MSDNKVPQHIAIIMDGNGRWAKSRGLSKMEGHRAGAQAVEDVIKACIDLGVKALSLYAFSTENWRRPKTEVNALMGLLGQYLKSQLPKLKKNKIRLLISGDRDDLSPRLQKQIDYVIKQTADNKRLILNLAINYGGREEIVQAAKEIAARVENNELKADAIDQKLFSRYLYTKELPDPDLLIRTSGEQRVSNFFLWQISYSELYFTPKFWPDFKKQDLFEAVKDYQKRERRYGA